MVEPANYDVEMKFKRKKQRIVEKLREGNYTIPSLTNDSSLFKIKLSIVY